MLVLAGAEQTAPTTRGRCRCWTCCAPRSARSSVTSGCHPVAAAARPGRRVRRGRPQPPGRRTPGERDLVLAAGLPCGAVRLAAGDRRGDALRPGRGHRDDLGADGRAQRAAVGRRCRLLLGDRRRGAGLGLYVVVRLAARHGVRVQLRDAKQGGVTAVIVLPGSILPTRPAPMAAPATASQDVVHTPSLPGSVAEANSNTLPARASRAEPAAVDGAAAPAAVPAQDTPGTVERPDGPDAVPGSGHEGTPDADADPAPAADPFVAAAERAIDAAGLGVPAEPAPAPAAQQPSGPTSTPRPNRARTARGRPARTAPPPAAAVSMRGPRRSRARPRTRHPRAPDRTPGPPRPARPRRSVRHRPGPALACRHGRSTHQRGGGTRRRVPGRHPGRPTDRCRPARGEAADDREGAAQAHAQGRGAATAPPPRARAERPTPRRCGAGSAVSSGGAKTAAAMSRRRSRNVQRSRPSHRRTPTERGPRERATCRGGTQLNRKRPATYKG